MSRGRDVESDPSFDIEAQFLEASKAIRKLEKRSFDSLSSIVQDAAFVEQAASMFKFPVACNERCGRWYVYPHLLATSIYCKSTDGHTGHCKFSLRRLNLHILPLIRDFGGISIVDSTRRGKRMPDALSKTVPIWACVINRTTNKLLQRNWNSEQLKFRTPSSIVSASENDKISAQIDSWVNDLITSGVESSLLEPLVRPMRPIWVTPASSLYEAGEHFASSNFCPIVLITASKCVPNGVERQNGFTYVQGAADDHENGDLSELTPLLFWKNKDAILIDAATCDETLKRVISVSKQAENGRPPTGASLTRIRGTKIYLADGLDESNLKIYHVVEVSKWPSLKVKSSRYLHIPIEHGKKGTSSLLQAFSHIEAFLSARKWQEQILIVDDENCRSKAAVVALLLITLYYDPDDALLSERAEHVDKDTIRNKLVTLVNSREGLNPSRAALKALNTHLMSSAYRH